jgi:glycine cleavage system H protein
MPDPVGTARSITVQIPLASRRPGVKIPSSIHPGETDMSEVRSDLKYRESHEWVRDEGDGTVTVGISDHAQAQLGDMVFVELPETGTSFGQGDACAVVESVKAASDAYAPVSGEIIEVNDALEDEPELVNSDPYGDGWMFRMKVSDASELDGLLSPEDYEAQQED